MSSVVKILVTAHYMFSIFLLATSKIVLKS